VLARDLKTGKQKIIEMKSAVDVEDSAVQQMVEESVEHAFEDMAARRWIEARLKAQQLIEATRKALDDCANELDADYKTQVETALRALDSAVGTENPQMQTGDLKGLQTASAALDEVTKPLAEMLMDRAMESLLRKRGAID